MNRVAQGEAMHRERLGMLSLSTTGRRSVCWLHCCNSLWTRQCETGMRRGFGAQAQNEGEGRGSHGMYLFQ